MPTPEPFPTPEPGWKSVTTATIIGINESYHYTITVERREPGPPPRNMRQGYMISRQIRWVLYSYSGLETIDPEQIYHDVVESSDFPGIVSFRCLDREGCGFEKTIPDEGEGK